MTKLYMFGGYNDKEVFNKTYTLSLKEMIWSEAHLVGEEAPHPRAMHTSEIISDSLYIFGGSYTTDKE